MFECIIKKSQDGRDMRSQHSTTYRLIGAPAFNSPQALSAASDLGQNERIIYPTSTYFMYALLRNLDAQGKPLRGQTTTVLLENRGMFAVPVNDKLASNFIVAAIDKKPAMGRSGVTQYRYCTTSEEYDQYIKSGAIPARFTDPNNLGDGFAINFLEGLSNIGGDGVFKLALPDAYGDTGIAPRPIIAFAFAGFRNNQPYRQKQSPGVSRYQATQKQINKWGADARFASRVDRNGVLPDDADEIVADLKADAVALRQQLPVELRSRIVMPEIFDNNPITGGV